METAHSKPQTSPAQCGIIIPVYNSPDHLEDLLSRITVLEKELPDWQLSILIVDDGSTPPVSNFPDVPNLSILYHHSNLGKGAALKSGFSYFMDNPAISAILTLDADLQHPPEHIPEFLRAFRENMGDIIIGSRRRDPKVMPPHRILSNYLTSKIISFMAGQKIADSQCGYRLYSRRALEKIQAGENRFHLESEFLIRGGWQQLTVGHVDIPTIYNGAPSAIRHLPDTLNFISLILRLSMERIRGHV